MSQELAAHRSAVHALPPRKKQQVFFCDLAINTSEFGPQDVCTLNFFDLEAPNKVSMLMLTCPTARFWASTY